MAVCECCEEAEAVEGSLYGTACEDCNSQAATYCTVCQGDVSRDDPCRHIFWSDAVSDLMGPGDGDLGDNGVCRESLEYAIAAIKPAAVERLRVTLLAHGDACYDVEDGPVVTLLMLDYELDYSARKAMEDGICWLESLESGKTDAADTMTAGWIAEWQAIERMWRT